jgi:ATP-binding cassette, subfamily B, bacterial
MTRPSLRTRARPREFGGAEPVASSPAALLRGLLAPQWRSLVAFGLVIGVATTIPLAASVLLARFVRLAVANAPARRLVPIAVAYAGLGLVASAMTVAVAWRATIAAWSITNGLRLDLADFVLRADLSFHRDRTPGELVTRVDADITSMNQFLSSVVAQLVAIVLLGIGSCIVALFLQPVLAPALLVAYLFVGWVTYALRNRSVAQTVAERAAEADMMSAAEQYLAGADDIAALGAGRHGVARVGERSAVMVAAARDRVREQMTMQGLVRVSVAAAEVGVIGFGAVMAARGSLDVAGVVLGYRLVATVSHKVDHLTWRLQDAQGASGAARRVLELVEERRVVVSGDGPMPTGPVEVRFEDTELVYDDEAGTSAAIVGLHLTLPAGRLLGVVGRTGSGKTSIARLALRLVAPTRGRVTLNGVDIATIDDVALRRRVTAVPQDVQLFPGTVAENVALFADHTAAGVVAAIEAVGLGDWLRSLPDGIATQLASDNRDDSGTRVGLSAGQAQLLALSRALLRDPAVVVLDEATSRVDPTTQKAIAEAMRTLVSGRTAMVIAHRLETLDVCDDIAVLADGKLVEYGPREALAADPTSRYARLLVAGAEAEELV